MIAIAEYYSCIRPEAKRPPICVLLRGPKEPRNSVGEVRLDSVPIVYALDDKRNRGLNILLLVGQLFANVYAEKQSPGDGDAELISFLLYVRAGEDADNSRRFRSM